MMDLSRRDRRRFPYPLICADASLEPAFYAELKADLPPLERFRSQVRMHGDLSWGDPEYQELIEQSRAWRTFHDWVYSGAFARFIFESFNDDLDRLRRSGQLILDPRAVPYDPAFREGRQGQLTEVPGDQAVLFSRLDVGYGLEGYGRVNGGKGIHIDNWPRVASILLYFSDHADFDGGQFCVYRFSPGRWWRKARLVIDSTLACAENRAIVSLQSNVAFHGVNEVRRCRKPRFAAYIALACNSSTWAPFPTERQAELSQSRRNRFLVR